MQKNLNQDMEKERIIRIINKVVKGLDIEAICMYGSRIAGYANEKSDYAVSYTHLTLPTIYSV